MGSPQGGENRFYRKTESRSEWESGDWMGGGGGLEGKSEERDD